MMERAPTTAATLHPMESDNGRRLLVGHTTSDIEGGSVLCLVRDGESYLLRALAPDQMSDLESLASFLRPCEVDEAERQRILDAVDPPKPARKRKPKAKR